MNSIILRLAVVVFASSLSLVSIGAEEWTNLRGTSTVVGKLLGIWNGKALLRLDNGRQYLIKLEELRSDSRIQAEDLQVEIDKRVKERVAEMDAIAIDAAAPAPPTLPMPKPAPSYQPPNDASDLSSALDHIQAQAVAGHMRVYFDALPKTQRAQADELMKLALQKIDPGSWELTRSTLNRLSKVAVEKQRWLFSHPKFASISESERESWLTVAAAIAELGTTENASYEKLQASPIADTVTRFDDILAPYIHQATDAISLAIPNYEVETGQNGAMLAKVVLPFVGTIQSISMVQLEGRWVEGATVEEAEKKWSSYKTSLDAIANGSIRLSPQAEAVLSSLSALVTRLEQAKNRIAFHRAIDDASRELGTAIASWAGVKSQAGMYGSDSMSMEMNMNSSSGQSSDDMRAAQEAGRNSPSGPPSP